MRSRLLAVTALLLAVTLAGCGSDTDPSSDSPVATDSSTPTPTAGDDATPEAGVCDYVEDGQEPAKKVELPPEKPTVSGKVPVLISTTAGRIGAVLDADAAPCTVGSFVSLAGQAYFDDTPCHRLTTAAAGIFVLQCGDPTGSGYGGPGYTIPEELTGDETYPAGTLAMARTREPHSGGSQFFLVYDETPLPADYTVFGRLEPAGLKVLREIAKTGTTDGGADGAPKTPVMIQSVTFSD